MLELLIFVLILTAVGFGLQVVRTIGKGVINVTFVSMTVGIIFIGLSRLFLFLTDFGIYHLEDATLHIWWHLLFYLGILMFIWGGIRLKAIATATTPAGFNTKDMVGIGVFSVLAVLIFLVAQPLENIMASTFVGSIVDTLGIHHFVAVILAGIAAYFMYYIKNNWGQLLGVSVTPILAFLALMGLQHLWELLTESLKILSFEEEFVETVEQFIVIPALGLLIFGLFRVSKFIQSQTNQSPQTTQTSKAEPV